MPSPWSNEIWRLSILLVLAWLVGLISGYLWLCLGTIVSYYLGYHLYQLYRLTKWLRGELADVPEAKGIWSEIFFRIYRIQQRNRKRKQRLIDILSRFRESTAAMPDATVILNVHGEIEWINKAAGYLLNLHSPADTGQRIGNLLRHPRFSYYLVKGSYDKPVQMPSPRSENIMLSVIIIPYGRHQRLLIARDITQLHKLEQIRRDFVANASHELRTPLTVLSGLVETLDELTLAEEIRQRSIKLMRQQSHRMQQIVNDLLLLTQLESEHSSSQHPICIPALIQTVVEDAQTIAGESQQHFELNLDHNLWLLGDEKEIRSAFMNLLSNAVRYTPEDAEITVTWWHSDNGCIFEVKDRGIGIAEQHIERLTERFYRVDVGRSRSTGGTGLGLAIVKHVMDRCGGRLEIESQLGQGSAFRCCFPIPLSYFPPQHEIKTTASN